LNRMNPMQTCRNARWWTQWRYSRIALTTGWVLILGGCAAGPDFVKPAPPQVARYTSSETPTVLAAGKSEPVQQLTTGKAISAQWWELYQSPNLNQVLEQAINSSPTLTAAKATLAQVQQALIQTQGDYYPQVNINAAAQRQGTSAAKSLPAATTNLYSVGATVSYAPDVFGSTRRQEEQAAALVENQQYQLAAAYLTLTGTVVTQAIDIASVRQQISAVQDIIADDEHNLQLVQLKFNAGKAALRDVLAAQSQLANDRALLPPLKQQLSVAEHALSVLIGQFPGGWSAPNFELTEFALPTELPVSIPSELVRQRPDILAAEAQLHASSAAIGVAASQLYPNIQLSGSLGVESLSSSNLFQASNQFWNLVASLTAPIFHGGSLEAQKQAAIYAFQASAASYQQTVLTAFGQVADVLRALTHDAELVGAQKTAFDISEASLKLQRLSYAAGKSDLLQLLDAERAYQQARLGYARAQAQRYQDTAQLFVAMGGGWWQDKNLAPPASPEKQQTVQD
jgi:NodT family efflux transporter outer membrane factor (OMF) lipoprotein